MDQTLANSVDSYCGQKAMPDSMSDVLSAVSFILLEYIIYLAYNEYTKFS